jgi:hypothetical protein
MQELKLSNITLNPNMEGVWSIYGSGIIGRTLKKILSIMGNEVEAFICSDGYKKENYVDGLPVYELSEYASMIKSKDRNVLMTV